MIEVKDLCETLLKECHNNLINKAPYLASPSKIPELLKKKINVNLYRSGISAQQLEENTKIIDKLRKKYHRKAKEVTIKKTTLGEDLLTFTPQQYAKLKLIDQYEEKGLIYQENIETLESSDSQQKSAVDRLKQLAKLDDVIEQVKTNLQWGNLPSQLNTDVNFMKRSASSKGGFQKRSPAKVGSSKFLNWKNQELPSNSQDSFKANKSLNKYFYTALHKKTFGKKHFLFTRYDSTIRSEELGFAEKIELIKQEAQRKTEIICRSKSPFMTEERKEAIYGCQLLRQSKKILKPCERESLQFSLAVPEGKDQEERDDKQSRRQKQEQNGEAQQILQKNYGRIKAERKRIIEKMVC